MSFSISPLAVFVTGFGHGLSQRLAAEFQSIGVVHNAVEDGVGEGGFADDIVPGCERQLAGDEGGACTVRRCCTDRVSSVNTGFCHDHGYA